MDTILHKAGQSRSTPSDPVDPITTNLPSGSGSSGSSDDRVPVPSSPTLGSSAASSSAKPVAKVATKADRIKHLLTTTAHVAVKDGTLYKCSRCYTKCTIAGSGIEEWLMAPCTRIKPQWMHSSHEYKFCEPLHYCQKCGFYARAGGQASSALTRECKKPTVRGKANLAHFAKGKLPTSFKP